jgi:hypothetical protein
LTVTWRLTLPSSGPTPACGLRGPLMSIDMRHSHAVAFCILLSGVVTGSWVYADTGAKSCGPSSPELVSTAGGPNLTSPTTEFHPRGWVNLDLTIAKNGKVIDVAVSEWHIEPDDVWLRVQIFSWARQLVFKAVERQCVYALPVKLKPTDDNA